MVLFLCLLLRYAKQGLTRIMKREKSVSLLSIKFEVFHIIVEIASQEIVNSKDNVRFVLCLAFRFLVIVTMLLF